ncbi:MAG TPA: hypothetical protein VLX68_14250 [Chitinivibrionales bacterium]|nr:hypothetical protein [Chitinivibrionales bacterium]
MTDATALFSGLDAGGLFPQQVFFEPELFDWAESGALVLCIPQVQTLFLQQQHWHVAAAGTVTSAAFITGCAT